MDLLVTQLKTAIRTLLDGKGIRARVLDKVNRYGEVVIGVILEKPAPPPSTTPQLAGASGAPDANASNAADVPPRPDKRHVRE